MDDKTIERIEEKYLITKQEKSALLRSISKHLARDEYFKEEVLSLYFDTKDYDLAVRSIDQPAFREKIRVRAYNVPKLSSKVFFEIKAKQKIGKRKISSKRRLILPLKSFYKYQSGKANLVELASEFSHSDIQQIQIAKELDYLYKYYQLQPKVVVSANRVAYVAKANPSFRLTFDEHLRFRTDKLRLEKGSTGEEYFKNTTDPKHDIIMEVKTMPTMPPWFVSELSKLHIYPARFSKYGKIYQLIKERK
ncbi:polyphosphate polymerase domain-containing protein [Candidatus Saccharibacteria bacterium]|nr:polyphosphate polymerase domain-containing protein [Candidatus Saccharibacteria bacterium]